ncbi:hypothetical protein PR202_gb23169 [Eleusine coracana subsp. coracana]|uniref:Pentatricopeptide repeat-containing protein n=1 Tax=Eleusine coracana subsp. coracana TaxID=191504 RepID=A0AAV5FI81_ELECO|nr:hypothetical protein PR202_gb23169 [Eleusine coracana subsp. coracana]
MGELSTMPESAAADTVRRPVCGRLDAARAVFDRVQDRNQAVYGSMIQAYGSHGHGVTALDVFRLMLANGVAPGDVCFVFVLSACTHGGLVEDGLRLFDMMDARGGAF